MKVLRLRQRAADDPVETAVAAAGALQNALNPRYSSQRSAFAETSIG
jgi:hypothetical protein